MRPFLTARWQNIVVLNYRVNSALLEPLVPKGTLLDFFKNQTFISLVGFSFEDTKFKGWLPLWPFQTFEEINLRFYVKRRIGNETRRAVCFVREVVPFHPISWAARFFYNEPYETHPARRRSLPPHGFSYEWKTGGRWLGLRAQTKAGLDPIRKNSLEEFILEHYWGYTRQVDGGTKEYRVKHPVWRVWKARQSRLTPGTAEFYGPRFSKILRGPAHSAFVAEGSAVEVFPGGRI